MDGRPVVIDSGSAFCKVGYAEDNTAHILSSTVSLSEDSFPKASIHRGIVADQEALEKLWLEAIRDHLQANPEEHPVLVTEPPLNPKKNREQMAQVVFEKLGSPGLYVAMPAVLALYSLGRTTGAVLDCGHGVCQTVPVYEGYSIFDAIIRHDWAGKDLTDYLADLLAKKNLPLIDPESICDIKEKLCYVPLDTAQETNTATSSSSLERSYKLPDGQTVTLNSERFLCPEALFKPSSMGLHESCGIDECVNRSIMKCEVDTRKSLYDNIVITGGSTMFPGLVERMQKEIGGRTNKKINIIAPKERKYSVWIGGSILASLSTMKEMWVSKREYEESGSQILYRKCF